LTRRGRRVISRSAIQKGDPMGWWAIAVIALFIAGIGVLNRVEFGRFD
jgi:hypothetical protein